MEIIVDSSFDLLKSSKQVTSIVFSPEFDFSLKPFSLLAFFPHLKHLHFFNCKGLDDHMLLDVFDIKELETVNVGGCIKITDKPFEKLLITHALKRLNVFQTGITNQALKFISNLTFLEHLNLSFCSISCSGIHDLKKISNLKSLSLNHCRFLLKEGLEALLSFRNLQHLSLNSSKSFYPELLIAFKELEKLETLNIGQVNLLDEHLAHLPQSISRLGLGWMDRLTDLAIFHICKLLSLKELVLNRCGKLTDRGLAILLKTLSLKKLDTRNCPLLSEGNRRIWNF